MLTYRQPAHKAYRFHTISANAERRRTEVYDDTQEPRRDGPARALQADLTDAAPAEAAAKYRSHNAGAGEQRSRVMGGAETPPFFLSSNS